MRSTLLLPILAILLAGAQAAYDGCCPTKKVENAPDASLNGDYILKKDEGKKREEICIDGCIYEKGGDEYCFIEKPKADSAEVKCEGSTTTGPPPSGSTTSGSPSPSGASPTGASTSGTPPTSGSSTSGSPPTTGSTTPGYTGSSTSGSPPTTGSTTPYTGSSTSGSPPTTGSTTPYTGSSTSGSPPTTGSTTPGYTGPSTTVSLEDKADEAHKEKERAEAAIAKAEKDKKDAEDTGKALDDVDKVVDSLAARKKNKRQAPTKPTSVKEFTDSVTQITTFLNDNKFTEALAIVNILKTLTKADLTFSADEIAAAKKSVTAAKDVAVNKVAEQINLIAKETNKVNEMIALIKVTNELLVAAGKPTKNPGTPLPTVATVPVPTPTPGPSTTGGSSPSTTPGGSPASSPASPPPSSSPTPMSSTTGPGRRRGRGIYLKHFGIEV